MPRVLVVDDEPGVRESLRMLLKDDCEVATAENVAAARRALDEAPPDLVLLDLVMPGGNGLVLLSELATRTSSCSRSNGFCTKSKAPRRIASTADSIVPYAVISSTAVRSSRARAASSTASPSAPGRRRSVTTTS